MAAGLSDPILREELLDRRRRLQEASARSGEDAALTRLLQDVDEALRRFEAGTYGLCDVCDDTVEKDRLLADPLLRTCLDHLNPGERRALERDLDLASRVQEVLLPAKDLDVGGWTSAFHYEPASVVSGDYCDLLAADGNGGDLYFLVGDVSGKGVAASLLMAGLRATVRTLIGAGLPVGALMDRANRLFCESTLPSHYATLVLGRATPAGEVEIANAGHCPPILIRRDEVTPVGPTGMPLGIFCRGDYAVSRAALHPGDAILLYTDGLSEARNPSGLEYGAGRLHDLARRGHGQTPRSILSSCLKDLAAFRAGAALGDDLTLLSIRRA
ncbi:MAG: SpoIIE family protein phosphatase [Candidatus Polarisedimenticolia bacterium]